MAIQIRNTNEDYGIQPRGLHKFFKIALRTCGLDGMGRHFSSAFVAEKLNLLSGTRIHRARNIGQAFAGAIPRTVAPIARVTERVGHIISNIVFDLNNRIW